MRAPGSGLLALLLVAPSAAETQTTNEPPPVEATQPTMAVTIEADEAQDGDNTRFEYTLRYLSTTANGAPVFQFEIGVPGSRDPITERPLVLESPPGWTGVAIPDSGSSTKTWRISWSCAHSGWDNRLKHQIRAGMAVGGFRAVVPRGAPGYATAPYRVFADSERGLGGALGTSGRVSQKRK